MTDHNRGAYTPQSDAPLAFDARRTGGRGERPFPITLVVSAVILLAVVAVAFYLYSGGVRGSDEPPQPVGEPVTQMKTPAPQEAQPGEPTNGLQVYADDAAPPGEPKLAPPPEEPVLRPTGPVESAAVVPPPPSPPPVAATPAAPVAATSKTAPAPAPKAATPPAQVAVPAPPARSSTAVVQIGAYSSASLADDGWSRLARSQPGQMAGKTKRIEEVELDGRTLYRALVGGFASRAEAVDFCAALQARGGSCTVRN